MANVDIEFIKEIERRRKVIQPHFEDAGTLADFASVAVRYIYHLSPGCYFERRNGSTYEWDLRPDNWVSIYLSKGRYGQEGKVVLSLAIPRTELSAKTNLEIKAGRLPHPSRVTIKSASAFKDALNAIADVGLRRE